MALDHTLAGFATEPTDFVYDWKTVVLYALGIGARRDELDYLYEGRGPKVVPTFAVVPTHKPLLECLLRTGGNLATVVHGGQSVGILRPIPPEGKLRTVARIAGIYDMKKMAQVVVETTTAIPDGDTVFETTWSVLYRGAGGFDGPPPPKTVEVDVPRDRPADFRVEQPTSPEQALLYRLSGDLNPLHADPDFAAAVGFPQGPILHGLCTYGHVARAVARALCGGDAGRIVRLDAQFRKPVWPGDTLVTEGWKIDAAAPGRVALAVTVKERSEAVLSNAWADVKG